MLLDTDNYTWQWMRNFRGWVGLQGPKYLCLTWSSYMHCKICYKAMLLSMPIMPIMPTGGRTTPAFHMPAENKSYIASRAGNSLCPPELCVEVLPCPEDLLLGSVSSKGDSCQIPRFNDTTQAIASRQQQLTNMKQKRTPI